MICTHCSDEIKPIVAVDIDGTLADYHSAFLLFAEQWLGRRLTISYQGGVPLNEHLEVDIETYRAIKLAYRQGGMKRSMPVFPGAQKVMHFLRKEGVEIWVTTTRPYLRLDNIDPDTREWLRRNDIPYDHLFYDDDKYARLIERVDKERIVAVMDDEHAQVVGASELGLPVVWRRSLSNQALSAPGHLAPAALLWEAHSLHEARGLLKRLIEKWRMKNEG